MLVFEWHPGCSHGVWDLQKGPAGRFGNQFSKKERKV